MPKLKKVLARLCDPAVLNLAINALRFAWEVFMG